MKQLHLRRGLSLAVTIAMLLTGCSLGGDSGVPEATQTAAAVPTASAAVAAPQTTASPVEQTGYGYTDSEQELQNVTFEKLVLLGGAPWLVTQKEDGSCQAEALESGETAALSSIEGSLLGACGGTDSLWYCIEQEDGVLLRQLDAQGEPTEIEDITLGQTYPMDMALDGEGYLYVLCADQILVYNSNGKNVSSLKLSDGMGTRLAALKNGQIVLTSSTAGSGHAVRLLNTESIGKDLTEADSQFIAYSGYMALLSGGGNLYAMNTDNNEMEILLNWVDSGVYPGILIDCVAADAEKIWYVTSSENGMKLGALKRVEASKLPQRETIDIGVSGSVDTALTARIMALAVDYNRSQESTHIHLVDYSLYGDGDSRLVKDAEDLDLVVGNRDVMDGAALTDLTKYYDEEVGKDTLLEGVVSATEADRLPMSFYLETLVASSTLAGTEEGWTPQQFQETVAAHSDIAVLKMCNSYDTLAALLPGYPGGAEGLSALLKACSQIPVEDSALYALAANASTDSAETLVGTGTLLLAQTELRDFMGLRQLQAQVGESMVFKGYPTESGNGTELYFPAYLGIPEKSGRKDAAWEFLKEILMDSGDFLGAQNMGFPVLQQEFMDLAQEATKKVTYQDENGNTVEQDPVVWVGGQALQVSPFTEAEITELVAWIGGTSGGYGCTRQRLDTGAAALKSVLESGADPTEAAKKIE